MDYYGLLWTTMDYSRFCFMYYFYIFSLWTHGTDRENTIFFGAPVCMLVRWEMVKRLNLCGDF